MVKKAKQLEAREADLQKQDAFYREQVARLEQRVSLHQKHTCTCIAHNEYVEGGTKHPFQQEGINQRCVPAEIGDLKPSTSCSGIPLNNLHFVCVCLFFLALCQTELNQRTKGKHNPNTIP